MDFFRGPAYRKFFDTLDSTGKFFYERWGDAPVHSIGVALLLPSRPFSDSATRSVPLLPLSVASDFRICPSQSKLTYDTLQNAALRPSLSTTIPQNPSFLTNSSFATGWLSFMLNLIGLFFTRKTRVRASKNASV